jgi:uncharacterized protein YbjT (DUF2867 family)
MKVILFGATGMVGQGVLRECLRDRGVERVLVVGRSATGQQDPKLKEVLSGDVGDPAPMGDDLAGYDACFFCLGVSSAGMKEADYRRITFDITLGVARHLAATSPGMTFVYVSGAGTDSSGKGRSMWARVKGETENALLKLPFKATYMFRPGFIRAGEGIVSRTPLYRAIYPFIGPLYPVLKALFPRHVTTTEAIGRAMIAVARRGAPKAILESADINALAAG